MASEIQGIEELTRKLSELGAAAGGKALRSALFTASLPALRAIQAAAPVGDKAHRTYKGRLVAPGFLRRNIRRKSLLSRNKQFAIVLVGPSQEAFYAQFLELGKKSKKGRSIHPFMERAFFTSSQQVVDRFTERLKVLIDKARK